MTDFPFPPESPRDRDDGGDTDVDGLVDLVRHAGNHDRGADRLSYDLGADGHFDLVREDPEASHRC